MVDLAGECKWGHVGVCYWSVSNRVLFGLSSKVKLGHKKPIRPNMLLSSAQL